MEEVPGTTDREGSKEKDAKKISRRAFLRGTAAIVASAVAKEILGNKTGQAQEILSPLESPLQPSSVETLKAFSGDEIIQDNFWLKRANGELVKPKENLSFKEMKLNSQNKLELVVVDDNQEEYVLNPLALNSVLLHHPAETVLETASQQGWQIPEDISAGLQNHQERDRLFSQVEVRNAEINNGTIWHANPDGSFWVKPEGNFPSSFGSLPNEGEGLYRIEPSALAGSSLIQAVYKNQDFLDPDKKAVTIDNANFLEEDDVVISSTTWAQEALDDEAVTSIHEEIGFRFDLEKYTRDESGSYRHPAAATLFFLQENLTNVRKSKYGVTWMCNVLREMGMEDIPEGHRLARNSAFSVIDDDLYFATISSGSNFSIVWKVEGPKPSPQPPPSPEKSERVYLPLVASNYPTPPKPKIERLFETDHGLYMGIPSPNDKNFLIASGDKKGEPEDSVWFQSVVSVNLETDEVKPINFPVTPLGGRSQLYGTRGVLVQAHRKEYLLSNEYGFADGDPTVSHSEKAGLYITDVTPGDPDNFTQFTRLTSDIHHPLAFDVLESDKIRFVNSTKGLWTDEPQRTSGSDLPHETFLPIVGSSKPTLLTVALPSKRSRLDMLKVEINPDGNIQTNRTGTFLNRPGWNPYVTFFRKEGNTTQILTEGSGRNPGAKPAWLSTV